MDYIVSIGASIPEFVATNDYVVSLALENSKRFYRGDTDRLERMLTDFLVAVGAKRRTWRAGFARPLDHIADAWLNCIKSTGTDVKGDIGALIYCGIDKGVIEPSHASLLAQQLGLRDVRTLDVSDACMGWFTATQIASTICKGKKPLCAIVTAEFPIEVPGKVYPESFKIKNDEEFNWKASSLTLGECAAVTLLNLAGAHTDHVFFESDHDSADLCCVPLERPERFIESDRLLKQLGQNCFVSNIRKLTPATYRIARSVLQQYVSAYGMPDVILPHTVSQTGPLHVSRGLVGESVLKNCFEVFGNISTCSIPIAHEFFGCGQKKHLHTIGWVTAAGLSCSAFRIY